MSPARNSAAACAGFTLLELVVVMGILTGFLIMLVRFVDTGVQLFEQGEAGQALSDRAATAERTVARLLQQLRGPSLQLEPAPDQPRLLVQWLPIGLAANAKAADPHAQFVRASTQLEVEVEQQLRLRQLLAAAQDELGGRDPETVLQLARQRAAAQPLVGHGGLWLFPWPQAGDDEGSLLELRVARFRPGQLLAVGGRLVDPMLVMLPGSPELPPPIVQLHSQVVLNDLLHFELRFWSQRTRSFEPGGGSELVWDSARAGWLSGGDGPQFAFDHGPESLTDPLDDVFPHAVQVLLVVGEDPQRPADGLLAADLGADDQELRLVNPGRFVGPADGGFVKVGPEWIRYGRFEGAELRALQRGCRGTSSGERPRGTSVRLGRAVTFALPLLYGKDAADGN